MKDKYIKYVLIMTPKSSSPDLSAFYKGKQELKIYSNRALAINAANKKNGNMPSHATMKYVPQKYYDHAAEIYDNEIERKAKLRANALQARKFGF